MGTTTALVPTSSTQWQPRDTTAVLSRAHLRASTVNTHPSRDTAVRLSLSLSLPALGSKTCAATTTRRSGRKGPAEDVQGRGHLPRLDRCILIIDHSNMQAHRSSREATTLSSPNRLTASLNTDTSSPWACSNSPSTSSSSLLRSQAWAAVPVVARAWLVPACVVAPRRPSATASSRRPPHRTYNDLDIHRP